jgi:type I restriction enzyme M protein
MASTLEKWLSTSKIHSIPPGKILCFITGKLRKDTPHERVRQILARSLILEYKYPKSDIGIEFRIKVGTKKYPVDIAIFYDKKAKRKENVYIVAEAEPEGTKPNDPTHGVEQVKSYVDALPNCKYGIWYNGVEKYSFQKIKVDDTFEIIDINDIPPKGQDIEDIEKPNFDQLRPATELRSVFKRCHNYIYG